jgi:excisionase family DNA binding protein
MLSTNQNPEPPKIAYSVKEAAQATSLGVSTVWAHIAAKRLPVVRVGGRTLIPADGLRRLFEVA